MSNIQNDEVIIGLHHSGLILHEGANTSVGTSRCGKCNKKIHCYVTVDRDTAKAEFHNTCSVKDCECKCRTHYACKGCGHLHPYDKACNQVESKITINPENEKLFQELIDNWRKKSKKADVKIV